jgi:hypothetical protein
VVIFANLVMGLNITRLIDINTEGCGSVWAANLPYMGQRKGYVHV